MQDRPSMEVTKVSRGLTLRSERLGDVPAGVANFRGLPFVFPLGSEIGNIAAKGCEWDAVLRDIVSILLPQADPIICDVGSNIGASFRQMHHAKPGARFLVFEPSARFRPFLEENILLANAVGVEVFPYIVSSEPGNVTLYNTPTTGTVLEFASKGAIEDQLVEAITLDALFAEREHPVHFIKIDTDGHDLEVLLGAAAVLERHRPVVYFEHVPKLLRRPEVRSDAVAGLEWLQCRGYRDFICLSPDGCLLGVTQDAGEATAWCDLHGYGDILACGEGAPAQSHVSALLEVLKSGDPLFRNAGREMELLREVISLQQKQAEAMQSLAEKTQGLAEATQRLAEKTEDLEEVTQRLVKTEKTLARSHLKREELMASARKKQDNLAAENSRLRELRWWRHPSRTLVRLFRR